MPEPIESTAMPAGARGATEALRDAVHLLVTRRFGVFWLATLLSNIGFWGQEVAQPWLLLSIGASPFLVGLDAFSMDAPTWLLTLVGGVLADQADRRRVIASFQSIQMLCAVVLVVLLYFGVVRIWEVIGISLLVGVTDALSMPSFQSIVPSIVPRQQISTGLALNATQFNLSRVLGPALAGILMTGAGLLSCYVVNAASYLPFILVAVWILPRRGKSSDTASTADIRHPWEGFRGLMQAPGLRLALQMVLLTSVLCGPIITFCPVLVKQSLHGGPGLFSVAIGSFGAGGLFGAMGLLAIGQRHSRKRIALAAAASYGLVVMLCACNPWSTLLPVLMLSAGACMSISNTCANTYLLSRAAENWRGQATGLYMLAMRGGASLGSLLTGVSVNLLGPRVALVINGGMALLLLWLIVRQHEEDAPHEPASSLLLP